MTIHIHGHPNSPAAVRASAGMLKLIVAGLLRKKSTATLGNLIAILALITAVAVFFVPAASPPDPFIITIRNQLKQPVTIIIDGKLESNLPAERTKTLKSLVPLFKLNGQLLTSKLILAKL